MNRKAEFYELKSLKYAIFTHAIKPVGILQIKMRITAGYCSPAVKFALSWVCAQLRHAVALHALQPPGGPLFN